ncbi:septum formation family protein [Streptomyces sp. NPDC059680]|uniref:septum formation family protein n=1 Tax=Streptomyces sp. NPDC059680 TaxID=3346904 RepID=UPI0036A0BEED
MQIVGTCHTFRNPEEMVQPSDVAPPVPCNRPHRSETFRVLSFAGPLAAHRERPDPEQMSVYAQDQCYDAAAIRQYLGAGPRDTVAFSVWPRVPTRAEWARGVRTLRCDLVPPIQEVKNGPLVAFSVRDVLARPESSAVRDCEHRGAVVTCNHPHDREEVATWLDLDDTVRFDDARAAAAKACKPIVEEFLQAKLRSEPTLMVKAKTPSQDEWANGVRTVKCGVGPAHPDATVVGTLSGSAKGRV